MLRDLSPDHREAVIDLLTDAFAQDPGYAGAAGGPGDAHRRKRRALFEAEVGLHFSQASPFFGHVDAGSLVSTALLSGVYLETEEPANLDFYRRLGYHEPGQTRVGSVCVWGTFRAVDSSRDLAVPAAAPSGRSYVYEGNHLRALRQRRGWFGVSSGSPTSGDGRTWRPSRARRSKRTSAKT